MLTDLDDFYCFAQVVEHGGFSAAERATDIPKSKLSRRVHNLEERLGVRLIQRSSRHFAVTEIGMNVYRHAQVMMNAAQAAHNMVDHLSIEPRGVIKVSLPVSIAQNEIAKILPKFLTCKIKNLSPSAAPTAAIRRFIGTRPPQAGTCWTF